MQTKNNVYYFISALIALTFTSCGGGDDDAYGAADISKFNLSSDAVGYVVTGNNYDDDRELYEILSNGSVSRVEVDSDKDDFYTASHIEEVIPVNDDYFIVIAGGSLNDAWSATYLVNRNSGETLDMTSIGRPASPTVSQGVHYLDGHIYFINDELNYSDYDFGAFLKVNVSTLNVTQISPSGDRVDEYAMDNHENIIMESTSDWSTYNTRFIDSNDSWHSLPGDNYSWDYMWRGLDDELYYFHNGIYKVNSLTGAATQWSSSYPRASCSWDHLLTIEDKGIMIGAGDCDTWSQCYPTIENYYTDNEFDVVQFIGASDSKDFAYLAGQLSNGSYTVLKIDPIDNSNAALTTDFEISGVISSEENEVVVTGFDLSNQQHFVGVADFTSGEVTVGQYFTNSITLQQVKGN